MGDGTHETWEMKHIHNAVKCPQCCGNNTDQEERKISCRFGVFLPISKCYAMNLGEDFKITTSADFWFCCLFLAVSHVSEIP